jgi:predicted ribosomally synthesized peptide with SipW-like signal peptide
MSRKLLLSSIAIAATATLLGVGTFAKFSDSEKSSTHSVSAGTLDLVINADTGPEYVPFNVTNAKPGDVSDVKMIHFTNAGTLPGILHVKVVMDSNADNGIVGPEAAVDSTDGAGNGELAANMLVTIDGIGEMQHLPLTTLDAAPATLWPYDGGILGAGVGHWVSVSWSIPDSVGNVIQSDSASFHVEFTLEQV